MLHDVALQLLFSVRQIFLFSLQKSTELACVRIPHTAIFEEYGVAKIQCDPANVQSYPFGEQLSALLAVIHRSVLDVHHKVLLQHGIGELHICVLNL